MIGKLAFKVTTAIATTALLFSCFLLYETYTLTQLRVNSLVEQQAALALQFNLSIRKYVADHIRPVMYDFVGNEEFIPETMSTSYISRAIFEDVRRAFPDFIIKFSADNPRNPINMAGKEELKLIEQFDKSPEMKRWQGEIRLDDKTYFALFSARRMRESCLRCHGDPSDAPVAMIEKYGNTAGFHQPLGEVIGLDTIAIPTNRVSEMFMDQFLKRIAVSGIVLGLFLLSIFITIRAFMTIRLTDIASHLRKAAKDSDYSSMTPIDPKGDDEIGDIVIGFNTISEKLRKSHSSLEDQVRERTSELEKRNMELRKEINYRTTTQDLLEQREATMRSIFSAAPTGIGVTIERILVQVNEKFCTMLGYSEDELLGRNTRILYPDNEEYDRVGKNLELQLSSKGVANIETIWRKKDGSELFILLSTVLIDAENLSAGITFTALDISEQKKAAIDKQYLEERLARSQKMEALGLLAGGVAHDLNNVLSGIVSYPELILLDLENGSPLYKSIQTIQESGKKAGAIVQDLLTLARRGVTHTEVLNLNKLIAEYIASPEHKIIAGHFPEIEISIDCSPELLNIKGSSIHLRKTVMNLISNAAEAIPRQGAITIHTENRYVDTPIRGYDEVTAGDFVVLTIRDTGTGIEQEDLEHIFEPFYTKKVMGRSGTGLGMSVVWGTVQDHSGYINIDSRVGTGTTFELFFPVTRDSLENQQRNIALQEYLGAGESILLVDDDKSQQDIAGAMLTKLGYHITTVNGGEEAVEYLNKHDAELVVLDMIMDPGIDGLETYKRIITIKPNQNTIIASGFSETERIKEAQRLGAGEYVKKPYTLERIGLAVKNALERQK